MTEEFAIDKVRKGPLENAGNPEDETRVRATFQVVHQPFGFPQTRNGSLGTHRRTFSVVVSVVVCLNYPSISLHSAVKPRSCAQTRTVFISLYLFQLLFVISHPVCLSVCLSINLWPPSKRQEFII